MKRRRILLFVLCSVAAITLAIFIWPREREPEYNGAPLSKWLERYNVGQNVEAAKAIQHIGTNALPFLLRWIQYEPPGWRYALDHLHTRLPSSVQKTRAVHWLFDDKAEERADRAVSGFEVLGPEAAPAWPDLVHLFNNEKAQGTQRRAWICMASIGFHSSPGDFDPF
jgi:hypothetical protein